MRALVLTVVILFSAARCVAADDRRAVPADDDVASAEAMMLELFGEQIKAARDDDAKALLSKEMLAAARQSEAAPKDHFVLLRQAQRLAIESGDCALSLEVAGYFNEQYKADPTLVIGKVLRQLSEESLNLAQREQLARAALEQMQSALDKKKFIESLAFGDIARVSARRARDFRLANQVTEQLKTLDRFVVGQQNYEQALEALLDDPDDASASLIAGRYECFVLDDWLSGLAHLSVSEDERLKKLVELEYKPDDSPEHMLALGDLWWEQSEEFDAAERDGCQLRAAAWYKAAGRTSGLLKVKIDKRLSQVARLERPLPEIKGVRQPSSMAGSINGESSPAGAIPTKGAAMQPIVRGSDESLSIETGTIRSARLTHSLRDGFGTKMVALHFSPDSKTLVGVGGDRLTVWNPESGQTLQRWTNANDMMAAVRFSPDGKSMAVVGNGTIRMVDTATGEARSVSVAKDWLKALSFSPDGRNLAIGGETGDWSIWDAKSLRPIRNWEVTNDFLFEAEYLPNGSVIVAGATGSVRVMDPKTGRQIRELTGHTDRVWSLAFSVLSNSIVTSSADRTICVWDLQTGVRQRVLRGHSNWVRCVDISPDGFTVASGGYDRTVRLWNLTQGTPIAVIASHLDGVESVVFSPDGKWLASSDRKGLVLIHRLQR